ncbi:MAG: hypothetical protein KGJ60_04275 [Verrucomicrobiota bacterium]|nr:hypothetical protein [Verrucomicrobiota bacterium]
MNTMLNKNDEPDQNFRIMTAFHTNQLFESKGADPTHQDRAPRSALYPNSAEPRQLGAFGFGLGAKFPVSVLPKSDTQKRMAECCHRSPKITRKK